MLIKHRGKRDMSKAHVLVVDDEPEIRELLADILRDEGYEVTLAADAAEARDARLARRPELCLLDIWMPGMDGLSLLKEWAHDGALPFPVIMMSGHGSIESAVEATRLGAWDFIEKPLSLAKLTLTIARALETERMKQARAAGGGADAGELLGSSPVMQALRERAARAAASQSPVLFTGEPGCGKETLARHVHHLSARAAGPFVTLHLGGIAAANLEAELFGSEARGVYYGRLEQAHGGTLFLAEITALEPAHQRRLVAALQSRSFLRVEGASPVEADVRLMAGTRQLPEDEVRAGRLVEDLYYLLNVLPFPVPPLRERTADIPGLARHFAAVLSARERLPAREFHPLALERLQQHPWPGNVRELINLVQRLLIFGGCEAVSAAEVARALGSAVAEGLGVAAPVSLDQPLREAREQFERLYLQHHMQAVGGRMGELARVAGLERTHLYRKLRSLGLGKGGEDEAG
jgi:DNA-binding NtrC family response regulator